MVILLARFSCIIMMAIMEEQIRIDIQMAMIILMEDGFPEAVSRIQFNVTYFLLLAVGTMQS